MMTPPCTVDWDERSLTSGWMSMVILLSWFRCGVTRSWIPIVVSCVMAFPAASATMSGIFWPTRILASRLSTVVMVGFEMMSALCSRSSACSVSSKALLSGPIVPIRTWPAGFETGAVTIGRGMPAASLPPLTLSVPEVLSVVQITPRSRALEASMSISLAVIVICGVRESSWTASFWAVSARSGMSVMMSVLVRGSDSTWPRLESMPWSEPLSSSTLAKLTCTTRVSSGSRSSALRSAVRAFSSSFWIISRGPTRMMPFSSL